VRNAWSSWRVACLTSSRQTTPASAAERIELAALCTLNASPRCGTLLRGCLRRGAKVADDPGTGHRYHGRLAPRHSRLRPGQGTRRRSRRGACPPPPPGAGLAAGRPGGVGAACWTRTRTGPVPRPGRPGLAGIGLMDPDFLACAAGGVRPAARGRERQLWAKLWSDVIATRNRARAVLNLKGDDQSTSWPPPRRP